MQTPYAYHLHVDDVGHTLVLGATGSGKSFLLNFLVTHLQQYDPLTVVLDLGHSYRKLATLLEGAYLELGIHQQAVTLNPFDLAAPTPEQLHFLHAFTRVLLEGEDGYRLSDREDREVYEAVENLFVLDRAQRRLFTLANLLPRSLGARLHKWVGTGRYAALFDHPHDTLTMDRLQVFDFEAMRAYPSLLEPLLFYVLHRVGERVLDPAEAATVKVCVMDEAWRLIQHPTLRAYVQEALKTWRKRNASMILATQSLDDFASADLLRTVVESCPTRLLLANPSLDRQQYAELLQMNERELDLLTLAAPAPADSAQAGAPGQGAAPARRSAQLLDLHELPWRQRPCGRGPPRPRLRRRTRPAVGVCLTDREVSHACTAEHFRGRAPGVVAGALVARPDRRHPRGDGHRPQPDPAADAAALHDDGGAPGGRGDPRRDLRRPRLLGHQRRAERGAREAGQAGCRDEPQPGHLARDDLLVPAHREERHRRTGPEGVRQRRCDRTDRARRSTSAPQTCERLQQELTRRAGAGGRRGAARDRGDRQERDAYPTQLHFAYTTGRYEKPFLVRAMWHDGQFTYLQTDATELPALYELKDGEPAALNFQVRGQGTYVVPKVLDRGYFALGKERFSFWQRER